MTPDVTLPRPARGRLTPRCVVGLVAFALTLAFSR